MSDKKLTEKDLSADQAAVYRAMLTWASARSPLLTVGGLAGTGKTTVLGVFAANVDRRLIAYVTFTGRASSILARKLKAAGAALTDKIRPPDGLKVSPHKPAHAIYDASLSATSGPAFVGTLHRLLYSPVVDPVTEELMGWSKRNKLDRRYDLIVIDEASMVGSSMLEDLKLHGVPIMAVGDHGQLPPVMDAGDLMKNPDIRLETIHRQAEGNPIIGLAHHIRECGDFGRGWDGAVRFVKKADAGPIIENAMILGVEGVNAEATESPLDVGILCWTNKMRCRLNGLARRAAGFSGPPRSGEVGLALKNNPPVYNGMRGILTSNARGPDHCMRDPGPVGCCAGEGHCSCECNTCDPPDGSRRAWLLNTSVMFPDEDLPSAPIELCGPQFLREKTFGSVDEMRARGMDVRSMASGGQLYDFGYALTVHKSQGSQFKHAIVFVDRPVRPDDEDWRRWAYTAVTRASERLTVIL